MSQTITLPQGATLTFPFPFPGFPQPSGTPADLPNLPTPPTLPTLPQGGDLSSIIAALLPLLQPLLTQVGGAANPLVGIAISALFAIGKAIHDQKQSQPPGTNKSLDELEATFWSHVTAFFPHPQPTQPAAG